MNAITVVEDEVRELVRRRGLDPAADAMAVRRLVEDVITDYDERTLTSSLPPLLDSGHAARTVFDAVAGFGPLQRHLDDPTVEEIWVNHSLPQGLKLQRAFRPGWAEDIRARARRRTEGRDLKRQPQEP